MKKVMHYLFGTNFATVLIYNNKDKIKKCYIVIINMVIMIINKIKEKMHR